MSFYKREYLAILVLVLFSVITKGQQSEKDTTTSDFKKILIGVNISPDICFRTLKNNNGSSTSDNIIKLRNENETVKYSYTAGLNVCFNLNKNLGIEIGGQYSNKGYQTKKLDVVSISGQPDPSLPTSGRFIYSYHYIDIPLKINFVLGRKKVRFFSSIGLTTGFFIKETQTSILEYSNGKIDKNTKTTIYTSDYKRINISPTISIGIDYKINNRMNLRVEPTFRYGVLKIIDTPITSYLWNGGLNIGYYIGL